jgi:bacillithiol synthase
MHEPSERAPFAAVSAAELDPTNRLLADFLAGRLTDLFPPPTPAPAPGRAVLAEALVAAQRRLGAHEAAIAQAARLADPRTLVVTAGQQTGLLTGPLYTLYKALTAVNLAARLGAETGRPAVAVFWAATDDDDRAEADSCGLWDAGLALHDVRYPAECGAPGTLIGKLPVGDCARQVLDAARPLLAAGSCGAEAAALAEETLAGAADLGEWCQRLLARLLSPLGLVFCDARLPVLRTLGAEVMRRELAEPLRTTALVNARAAELRERGYRATLTKPAECCNAFLLDDCRQRIRWAGDAFEVGGCRCDAAALRALLAEHPERFLPNAVLRPVLQEALLASHTFVAGPNEVGYWAELAPVFAALAVPMPRVVVRAGATVLPRAVARHLREWEIAPLDLLHRWDAVRFTLLGRAQPEGAAQAFADGRAQLAALGASLATAVGAVDPTLAASARGAEERMRHELERLERKALQAVERREQGLVTALAHARDVLFPGGGPQERALNVMSLAAREGIDVVQRLRTLLDRQEGRHVFVEL